MSRVAETLARLESENVDVVGPDEGGPTGGEESGDDAASTEVVQGEGTTAGSEAAKPPAPAAAPPAAKTAEEEKAAQRAASQFAALTREKREANRLIETAQQHASALKAREEELQKRERELEGVLDDPRRVFEVLQNKLGIRNEDDLRKYANGVWQKPQAPVKDEDRPLTRREIEEEFAKREAIERARTVRQQVESDYLKRVTDAEKYPTAALLYDERQLVALGDQIAEERNALGERWTFEEICEEVEKRARQDRRYAILEKRQTGAAPAKAATAQASKPSQPAKPASDTRDTDAPQNGASRASHGDRMARLRERYRGE